MSALSEEGIQKLCTEDIMQQRRVPEIQVCPQQKMVYKFANCQTLEKQCKNLTLKNEWKLNNFNAPNSIKISSWAKYDNDCVKKQVNEQRNICELSYRVGNSIFYDRFGLHSMEWTLLETDLLFTLCQNYNNRWSVIIDRYNLCKPRDRPNKTVIEIKQRFYECKDKIESKNENVSFKYNGLSEQKRRKELSKLLMRTQDSNVDYASTTQSYYRHSQLLNDKINEMNDKKFKLEQQNHSIALRQQNEETNIPFIDKYQMHGYGLIIKDMHNHRYSNHNNGSVCVPNNCIPRKIPKKVERHIRMIGDEYTKYKYELKLDGTTQTIVPFPFIDKIAQQNSSKKKSNNSQNSQLSEEQLLSSSNPLLGKEIAKMVQNEMVKSKIVTIDNVGLPRIDPMTSTTRELVNTLTEDYIKYYALQTMINDLKKEQK